MIVLVHLSLGWRLLSVEMGILRVTGPQCVKSGASSAKMAKIPKWRLGAPRPGQFSLATITLQGMVLGFWRPGRSALWPPLCGLIAPVWVTPTLRRQTLGRRMVSGPHVPCWDLVPRLAANYLPLPPLQTQKSIRPLLLLWKYTVIRSKKKTVRSVVAAVAQRHTTQKLTNLLPAFETGAVFPSVETVKKTKQEPARTTIVT